MPVPRSFGPAPALRSDPDWLFPGAITSLALGGAMMVGGAAAFGAVDGGEYCGITGCTTRPDGVPVNAGASLIGAGAGFVTVGGTSLLGWALNHPEGSERRRNELMMITGFSATTLGAAGLGLGFAQAATYDDRSADFTTSWPLFLSSGVLLAGGIPLFAVGAFNESDADRSRAAFLKAHPPMRGEGEHHSIPMAVTGGVLTGIAGLGALGTTALVIGAFTSEGYLILGTIVTEPVATVFSAVGVPLLVAGLHRDGIVPSSVPSFGAGPAGLTATWSLQ